MSETPDFQVPTRAAGDSAIPRFYVKPVQNNFRTNAEGRPVFEDRECVEIHIPGDRRSMWDGMVSEIHKQRFPREYAAFKSAQEAPSEGLPLTEWPAITRSQAEELAYVKVRTVEQLAALSDAQIHNTIAMGGHALRDKARRTLEQAAGSAPNEKLAAENEALKAKLAEVESVNAAVLARLDALERGQPAAEPAPLTDPQTGPEPTKKG